MILKRYYDDKLAQASYLVGCATTGEALIVDPHRDIEQYIAAAEAEGLRLTHVTETHIHADFVSGLRELAVQTGAQAYLSGAGGPTWQYGFATSLGAVLLRDGDEFMVGNIRVQAVHTPGHTPEHMSYLITDTSGADRPMGIFTGDFLFVGDVGRPDLLEKAAGVEGSTVAGARQLFRSLQRLRDFPDWLQLWPGHGAGSACGKSLGAVPSSTLGYERLFNWAFSIADEDRFVTSVLAGQPEPPRYFAEMKRINRDGPRVLDAIRTPARLGAERLETLATRGALIVDTRPWAEFRAGAFPRTINIPRNRSFLTWAGWLIPYDRDFYLIVEPTRIEEVVRDLSMIGLDRVAGWFEPRAVQQAEEAGTELVQLGEITVAGARERITAGDVAVVDVRSASEWHAAHLPDVPNIPLGYLRERLAELPAGRPLVLYCQSGNRSGIAASLLAAHGITNVLNLQGGIKAWTAAGNPVEPITEPVAAIH